MHLITIAYFLSYHTFATIILRKSGFFDNQRRSLLSRVLQVAIMSYATALLEAWSISAFPHYVSRVHLKFYLRKPTLVITKALPRFKNHADLWIFVLYAIAMC